MKNSLTIEEDTQHNDQVEDNVVLNEIHLNFDHQLMSINHQTLLFD